MLALRRYAVLVNTHWIEYRRRSDGERLGWIEPEGEGFVAIDLLGVECTAPLEWEDAEQYLEQRGLAYVSEPYELRLESGEWVPVRITGVSPAKIQVKTEDYGAIDVPSSVYNLRFPKPNTLRLRS